MYTEVCKASELTSSRKKYRKLKLQFEEKMRESNNHYVEQHKAVKVAKRLQEQNEYVVSGLMSINTNTSFQPITRTTTRH